MSDYVAVTIIWVTFINIVFDKAIPFILLKYRHYKKARYNKKLGDMGVIAIGEALTQVANSYGVSRFEKQTGKRKTDDEVRAEISRLILGISNFDSSVQKHTDYILEKAMNKRELKEQVELIQTMPISEFLQGWAEAKKEESEYGHEEASKEIDKELDEFFAANKVKHLPLGVVKWINAGV